MCHPEVPAGQEAPNVVQQEVEIVLAGGERMPASLTRPEGAKGPGVIVIGDIFGRSPFYENLAARLAQAGFVALVPDFFFREGPLEQESGEAAFGRFMKLDQKRSVKDFSGALDWLKEQDGVDGARVGSVGCCSGGTFVFNLAAERSDLASVAYYGFPASSNLPLESTPPLEQVDAIKGPILAFWGDQDTLVGMQNVDQFAEALRARDVDYEQVVYPGIGHGFLQASKFDPDSADYETACDSWTRTIAFLREKLGAA